MEVKSKRGYKYRLVRQSPYWRFELLPNNSNTQPVGNSGNYSTYEEALKGLHRFKLFMTELQCKGMAVEVLEDKQDVTVKCRYKISFGKNEFFTNERGCSKKDITNAVARVLKNYHAAIRTDL